MNNCVLFFLEFVCFSKLSCNRNKLNVEELTLQTLSQICRGIYKLTRPTKNCLKILRFSIFDLSGVILRRCERRLTSPIHYFVIGNIGYFLFVLLIFVFGRLCAFKVKMCSRAYRVSMSLYAVSFRIFYRHPICS